MAHMITLIRTVMIRVHISGTAPTRRATIRTSRLARAGGCKWYRTADLRIEQGPVLDASADIVNGSCGDHKKIVGGERYCLPRPSLEAPARQLSSGNAREACITNCG